jgi:hypothetical protein
MEGEENRMSGGKSDQQRKVKEVERLNLGRYGNDYQLSICSCLVGGANSQ